MRNKFLSRIIVVILLCAFLTFSVGRVTRVSAVGTTIAAASAAALLTVGIVYCSYMALTGATVHIPDTVDNVHDWLSDMGSKVVQYPSGRAAYEELYPELVGIGDEPLHRLLDRAWTWTEDKIKAWANDFSSTAVITSIASYEHNLSVVPPAVQFTYDFAIEPYLEGEFSGNTFIPVTITNEFSGARVLVYSPSLETGTIANSNINNPVRNYYSSDTGYLPQVYVNGEWQTIGYANVVNPYYVITWHGEQFCLYWSSAENNISVSRGFPSFVDGDIYDADTDTVIEAIPASSTELVRNPQWPVGPLPPDDEFHPVIPFVEIPNNPLWTDPITGNRGGGNWGFNLSRLLDILEDLAGLMMEIGAIGDLINEFKDSLSGSDDDVYYIYYDDSTNNINYFDYYTITNYNGDVYQYDIDVSQADEHLPVDLNSIQKYTQNRYIDSFKHSAIAGGSIIRDLVVFWYDVDPEIVYVIFGTCIITLIAAFIGKWGHS